MMDMSFTELKKSVKEEKRMHKTKPEKKDREKKVHEILPTQCKV